MNVFTLEREQYTKSQIVLLNKINFLTYFFTVVLTIEN